MAVRVVVWGYGAVYFSIANTLFWLADQGQIELVGYVADSFPANGKIDGAPIIAKSDLNDIEYDVVVLCVDGGESKAIDEACSRYGVVRDKIVPCRVLQMPRFNMDDYLELKRSNVSIVANLCWGGLVSNVLGLPALSPFRNLWIGEEDYMKLLGDLKRYCTEVELKFSRMARDAPKKIYPVMRLDDVELHFNHVKFPWQAKREWNKRKDRINWDNLFVEMHTPNRRIEKAFNALDQYEKRICFVPHDTDLPHSFTIPPDGEGSAFYDQVNGAVIYCNRCYLYNPIPLLLGRDDFARYSK